MFATAGVEYKAAEVLTQGSGAGDHLILLPDICTRSILGDSNLRVVSPPGRILRANVHVYKSNYNTVLEQLIGRYRIFENLTDIMGISDVALDEYKVRMNKSDDELKNFMLPATKKCRAFKSNNIGWIPPSSCGLEEGGPLTDFSSS